MNKIELSIIVVSYNTREMTLECLRSVFSETKKTSFELIVLDNTSDDGSADAIESEFGDKVHLIRSKENVGFAAGNNLAVKNIAGEKILLLNPDTIVLNGAIDNLFHTSNKQPEACIWGGKTLFPDGTLNPSSCWSKQSIWSLFCQAIGLTSLFRRSSFFNPEGIGGWDREGIRRVDIVSGCFLLIKRELWESLNGFQEIFFMYGEEADLCLRANSYGAHPMITSDAVIIHYGGASEKVRDDKLIRLLKAKMLLIREHFPKYNERLAYWLLYLWPYSRYIAHSILSLIGRNSSRASALVWRKVLLKKDEWVL